MFPIVLACRGGGGEKKGVFPRNKSKKKKRSHTIEVYLMHCGVGRGEKKNHDPTKKGKKRKGYAVHHFCKAALREGKGPASLKIRREKETQPLLRLRSSQRRKKKKSMLLWEMGREERAPEESVQS